MLASTLCTIAAFSAALASPIASQVTTIPLSRREVYTRNYTTLEQAKERIGAELDHLSHKYARAAGVYRQNTGRPMDGSSEAPPSTLARRQKEHLRLAPHVYSYVGTVQIGTPMQSLTISIDTGSSDLWIPSTTVVNQRVKFDTSKSSSVVSIPGNFAIQYADGGAASGPIYQDTVSMAGKAASGYTFSAVTKESGEVQNGPADGVFGFAMPSLSISRAPMFIQSLADQGVVRAPVFSMFLPFSGAGILYLGGFDSTMFRNQLTYSAVIGNSFWRVAGAYHVNGVTIESGAQFVVDSGTSLIVAPVAAATKLFAAIPGSRSLPGGLYEAPCTSLRSSSVSFSFVGDGASKQLSIPGYGLVYGNSPNTPGYCISTIQGVDGVVDNGGWILGDVFLAFVYTTFDVGNHRVGFAELIL